MHKKMETLQSFLEKRVVSALVLVTLLVAFSLVSNTCLAAVSFRDLSRFIEDYYQKNQSVELEFTDGFILAIQTYGSPSEVEETFLLISSDRQKFLEFNRGPCVVVDLSSIKAMSETIQVGDLVNITGTIKMLTKDRVKELEKRLRKVIQLNETEEKEVRAYYSITGIMKRSGIISLTQEPEKVYYVEASKIEITSGHDQS